MRRDYTPSPTSPITAILARLPRRTTIRAGRVSTGHQSVAGDFTIQLHGLLGDFAVGFRSACCEAQAGSAASAHEFGYRPMRSVVLLRRRRRCGLLPGLRLLLSAETCAPSFHRHERPRPRRGSPAVIVRARRFFASIGCSVPDSTSDLKPIDLRLAQVGEKEPVLPHQIVRDATSTCRTFPPAAR